MVIFNNTTLTDYHQVRCVVIGVDETQIQENCLFEPWPDEKGCLLWCDKPNDRFIVKRFVKLSDVCSRTGMVSSKKDYYRKLKAGAVNYRFKKMAEDKVIDATIADAFHEVRIGKRILEIVVPKFCSKEKDLTTAIA